MSLVVQLGPHSLLRSEMTQRGQRLALDSGMPVPDDVEPTYNNRHVGSYCYGLPYQDHNYGAPPPPTPPATPPPAIVAAPVMPVPLKPHTSPGVKATRVVNGHVDIDNVLSHTEIVTTSLGDVDPTRMDMEPVKYDDSVTRCVCDFTHDDGYMISCDRCGVWQHVDCMDIDRVNIPDRYNCERCEPRPVNRKRARDLQMKRRLMLVDSSATETEDETKTGRVGGSKDKRKKAKLLVKRKQRRISQDKMLQRIKKNNALGAQTKNGKSVKKSERSPFGDDLYDGVEHTFEEAELNEYSDQVLEAVSEALRCVPPEPADPALNSAQHGSLVRVKHINTKRKALEVYEDISYDQPVMEFRGKVLLRHEFDKENVYLKAYQPYVLFYDKFASLDLCIDASSFGSDARFVRRSCSPNAEVRHVIRDGIIHFFIYTLKGVPRGSEITIPFDYNYQECPYGVECACTKINCPIMKTRSSDAMMDGKRPVRRQSRANSNAPPRSPIRSPLHSPIRSPKSPKSPKTPRSPAEAGISSKKRRLSTSPQDGDTSCEFNDSIQKSRKMTREERKMEAIMKAFDRLERKEQRSKKDDNVRTKGTKQDDFELKSEVVISDSKHDVIASVNEHIMKIKSDFREETLDKVAMDKIDDKTAVSRKVKLELEEVSLDMRQRMLHARTRDLQEEDERNQAKRGKKRKGSGGPARRRSRMNSSCSSTAEAVTSADERGAQEPPAARGESPPAVLLVPTQSTSPAPGATPVVSGQLSAPADLAAVAPAGGLLSTPASATGERSAFRFPKTKKHLMNEWLTERGDVVQPLSIRTENSEETADFVRCTPSPHTNALPSHLRRNSASGAVQSRLQGLDTTLGSAKKRWLRQAMFENATHSPGSATPPPLPNGEGCGTNSPGGSPPPDFVTPLKKRRLARETVDLDVNAASENGPNVDLESNSSGGTGVPLSVAPSATENVQTPSSPESNNASNTTPAIKPPYSVEADGCSQSPQRAKPNVLTPHGDSSSLETATNAIATTAASVDDNIAAVGSSDSAEAEAVATSNDFNERCEVTGVAKTTASQRLNSTPAAAADSTRQLTMTERWNLVTATPPSSLISADGEISSSDSSTQQRSVDSARRFSDLVTSMIRTGGPPLPTSTRQVAQVDSTSEVQEELLSPRIDHVDTTDSALAPSSSCASTTPPSGSDTQSVSSSTSPGALGAPTKKKMSLADYRKRVETKRSEATSSTPSSDAAQAVTKLSSAINNFQARYQQIMERERVRQEAERDRHERELKKTRDSNPHSQQQQSTRSAEHHRRDEQHHHHQRAEHRLKSSEHRGDAADHRSEVKEHSSSERSERRPEHRHKHHHKHEHSRHGDHHHRQSSSERRRSKDERPRKPPTPLESPPPPVAHCSRECSPPPPPPPRHDQSGRKLRGKDSAFIPAAVSDPVSSDDAAVAFGLVSTPVSLTERLRRDFGIDASDSDADADADAIGVVVSTAAAAATTKPSRERPPPPPPPPRPDQLDSPKQTKQHPLPKLH